MHILDDPKEKGRFWELKEEGLCGELASEKAMDLL
jgi:hypothetical protein